MTVYLSSSHWPSAWEGGPFFPFSNSCSHRTGHRRCSFILEPLFYPHHTLGCTTRSLERALVFEKRFPICHKDCRTRIQVCTPSVSCCDRVTTEPHLRLALTLMLLELFGLFSVIKSYAVLAVCVCVSGLTDPQIAQV